MAHSAIDVGSDNVWIISGRKLFFKELEESEKSEVQLGNDKAMEIEGKGTVSLKTSHGNIQLLHDVQYVPYLGLEQCRCFGTNKFFSSR